MSAACVQVHFSSQSLFEHLRQIQNDDAALMQFADTLLSILRDNLHNDRCTDIHSTQPEASYFRLFTVASSLFCLSRVSIPFVKMLDLILTNGFFDIFTTQER